MPLQHSSGRKLRGGRSPSPFVSRTNLRASGEDRSFDRSEDHHVGGPRFEAANLAARGGWAVQADIDSSRHLGASSMTRHRALDPPQGGDASEVSASSRKRSASARQTSGSRAQMLPVAGALTPTLRPQRLPVLVGARERVRSVTIGEPMACHRSGVAVTCSCILADAVRRTSLGAVREPRRTAGAREHCRGFCCMPSPVCSLPDSTRHGGGRLSLPVVG